MIVAERTAAIVLAAGASSRFGRAKMLASLGGKPLLQHVLDVAAELRFARVVVVLGDDAGEIEAGLSWRSELRVRNPAPKDGLSSSLRVGLRSLDADRAPADPALSHEPVQPELSERAPIEAAVFLLGDQPLVRAQVIETLLASLDPGTKPIVVPEYRDGGGANPVLIHRRAWHLAAQARADRGLGPVIARRPDLVLRVEVDGSNPDVDTPADLDGLEPALLRADRPSAANARPR